jgi:ABC-2 type transport system permease protein
MGRLTHVELRRYLARGAVRMLIIGMVAAVLVAAFSVWRTTQPPSQAQVDEAQRQYAIAQSDWVQNGPQMIATCKEHEAEARQTDPSFACDKIAGTAPTLDSYLPSRETFAASAGGWLGQVGSLVLLLSLIVGATFVAAEFSTGALSTWLTFEPRRGRVFASKAVVVTAATAVTALVVTALAVGVFWVAAAVNHATGDVTAQTLTDLGNESARGAAAAGGAALLGAVLAFLLRHTAAVIAVVIAWLIAVDKLLVIGLLQAPRWSATYNLQAWLNAGFEQTVGPTSCSTDAAGTMVCDGGTNLTITMAQAGVTLAGLLAVAAAVALLVFQRRDVA